MVEIQEPEGDWIGSGWIRDAIQDMDVEDPDRYKVSVTELIEQ